MPKRLGKRILNDPIEPGLSEEQKKLKVQKNKNAYIKYKLHKSDIVQGKFPKQGALETDSKHPRHGVRRGGGDQMFLQSAFEEKNKILRSAKKNIEKFDKKQEAESKNK